MTHSMPPGASRAPEPAGAVREVADGAIGRRVKSLRERAGIPLIRVAADAGISMPTLRALESGKSVTVTTLRKVATALGVTLSDLVREDAL